MRPLLSLGEFLDRVDPDAFLPLSELPEAQADLINRALEIATGEIVAHLPWLLDETTAELALPLPAQFADALAGVCTDIAFTRVPSRASDKEADRDRYKAAVALLRTIAQEHQGGLLGPDLQAAEIVEPDETAGITDSRFFKKGAWV